MFKTLSNIRIGAVMALSVIIVVCDEPGPEGPDAQTLGKADHNDPQLPIWRKRYHDYYLDTVQPILDRRCVTCHSCYNAPCQLKLSSYEGVRRGATKKQIYKTRLIQAMEPTRLFVDPINPFALPGSGGATIGPIASQADLELELATICGRHGDFIRPLPDVAFLRVIRPGQPDLAYTIVRNRAHQNVSFITLEDFFVDPKHDTLHVMRGFAASYPNFFFVVRLDEAQELLQRLLALKEKDGSFKSFVTRFGVRRGDPRLWTTLDWFHDRFHRDDPIRAGLFDINRYQNF